MSKLFALEELDEVVGTGEMETSVEEGEVADVQVDIEEEVSDAGSQETAIDDGMGAADQLEEIEGVVEASIEEGEGLDPIAAEAVRIAVEAICARVGANPKSMYALYATENFQSASSRKANSRIALEGIGDFLKNLWEKIKAAVSNLWEKVKAFWDKHLSSLGRIKKALESAKNNVNNSKGTPKVADKDFEAGSLGDVFAGKGPLSAASVSKYIENHKGFYDELGGKLVQIVGVISFAHASAAQQILDYSAKNKDGIKIGTESAPLVGGVFKTLTLELDKDKGEGDALDDIKVNWDTNEDTIDSDKDRKLILAPKDKLKDMLSATIKIIEDDIKAKAKIDKVYKAFFEARKELDKQVQASFGSDDKKVTDAARNLSLVIRAYNTIYTKIAGVALSGAAYDVRLAKGVIGYVNTNLKQYK